MEDLESLLEDLGEFGLNPFLIPGKDFGFGNSLQGECDGKRKLWFTQDAVERLKKKGLVDNYASSMLSLSNDFNDTWKSTFRVTYTLSKTNGNEGLWYLWGGCGDSGFGTKWFQYHFKPRTVKRLQSRLFEKIKAVRF